MAVLREVSRHAVPVDDERWIVVERGTSGKFYASGTAPGEAGSVYLNSTSYNSLTEAVAAAQTWAFHHEVEVIYVCTDP